MRKYADFMDVGSRLDVLFFGSSRMLYAVNPVQLFDEYGITAYNMGRHGCMTTESYWLLVNALDYCRPKCVVVDVWALEREYHYDDVMDGMQDADVLRNNISLVHEMTDFLPLWSSNRLAAIRDLIQDPEIRKKFYWDFTLYHSRWDHLIEDDYKWAFGEGQRDLLLGAGTWHEMAVNDMAPFREEETAEELGETVCVEYLRRIIDLCREKDIQLVLTFMPAYEIFDVDLKGVNTVNRIAAEEGIPFFDFLHNNITDMHIDLPDGLHLNSFGMHKVTSFIGNELRAMYDLEDHRGQEGYELFETRVQEWQADWLGRLTTEQVLYKELAEIHMLGANAIIFMPAGSAAPHDRQVQRLIRQISGTDAIDRAADKSCPYMMLIDHFHDMGGGSHFFEAVGDMTTDAFDTLLGSTTYIGSGRFGAIYANGNFEHNYLDMDEHFYDEVQILILGQDGEVMARLCYDENWKLYSKDNTY